MKSTLVTSRREIHDLITRIGNAEYIGFDTESSGPNLIGEKMLNVYRSQLTGFSVAFADGASFYVPLNHRKNNAPFVDALGCLSAVFDGRKDVWAHNWKHDLKAIDDVRIPRFTSRVSDSVIAAWLCQDSPSGRYGLKYLAREHLSMKMDDFTEVAGKDGMFAALDPKKCYKYACEDALATLRLGERYIPRLRELGLYEHFFEVEMPFMELLLKMENRGMLIDTVRLDQLAGELQEQVERLKKEWDYLCPDVLITSPKQVSEYFFGAKLWPRKGVPVGASGQLSVNAETMRKAVAHPKTSEAARKAAEIRLEFQYLSKNLNTYTHALIDKAAQFPDGRIHCSFNQTGTATGRLASSSPNLQNIPVRTAMGKKVKNCFIPEPGRVLVAADYSQIELRVLAHLAGDGALARAYGTGADIHQQTADLVGCSRDQAKTVNFATVYGAHSKKLATQLCVGERDATHFLEEYHKAYPEVNALKKRIVKAARNRGFVKTLGGRYRFLPDIQLSDSYETRVRIWRAERLAMNSPIQGGAADICKLAMLAADDAGLPLISQVHDEITCEPREKDAEEVGRVLQKCMENAKELAVPLVAEPKIGHTWGECK